MTSPVQPDMRKNMKAESPHKDLSSKKRPLLPILQHQSSICTSTPISSASLSKKRKLSLSLPATHHSTRLEHFKDQTLTTPPGQSSILKFFKYSVQGEGRVADKSPEKSVNISVVDFYGEAGNKSLVNSEPFSCSLCNKNKFKSKKSWQAHITKVHKDLSEPVIMGADYECHLNLAHSDEPSRNELEDVESDVVILDDDDSLFKLESNNEISCYLCAEAVMLGDDYRCHLKFSHGVDDEKIETIISKL